MTAMRAEESDLDKLLILYRHLHADDVEPAKDHITKTWQNIILSDCFIYFVIEQNDVLVSSCNLAIIPNLTRGGKSLGLIENVVTHQDYRKRGFGKAVMSAATDYAKEHNCYKVMLSSNAQRKSAHKFYEALGFSSEEKIGYVKKLF